MLQEIGNYCFISSGLEEFAAPPGLKRICCGAFIECENLKRVILNEGLEELSDAFQESGIEEITLPSTLEEICCSIFRGCFSLRTVYVRRGFQLYLNGIEMLSTAKIVRQ